MSSDASIRSQQAEIHAMQAEIIKLQRPAGNPATPSTRDGSPASDATSDDSDASPLVAGLVPPPPASLVAEPAPETDDGFLDCSEIEFEEYDAIELALHYACGFLNMVDLVLGGFWMVFCAVYEIIGEKVS